LDLCLSKKNKCPHCRKYPFCERKINKNIKNLLNETILKCPLDCNEIIKYKNLKSHFENCINTPKLYKCSLCKLKIKVEENVKTEIEMHNLDCPNLLFKCPECLNNFLNKDIKDHISNCNDKSISCEKCFVQIPEKLSLSHTNYYCKLIINIIDNYKNYLINYFN
jgi:hypothetical protein